MVRTPSLTLRVTSRRQAQQLIAAVRTPSLTLRVTFLKRKVRRAPLMLMLARIGEVTFDAGEDFVQPVGGIEQHLDQRA